MESIQGELGQMYQRSVGKAQSFKCPEGYGVVRCWSYEQCGDKVTEMAALGK